MAKDKGGNQMIERCPPQMKQVWSDENKFSRWLDVVQVCEARRALKDTQERCP